MKVHRMVAAELRRLVSTRMLALALFALLCVPILYGGLYLWANQDPYGRLGSIPVALVNQDKGAPIEGERRDLGAEVIKRLVESGTFAFSEVDAAEAEAGLASGRYDFAIVIPADFSAAIASVNDAKPRQTSIELHANDANNYLATTIGRNAAAEVQAEIDAAEGRSWPMGSLERFEFYERARNAYCVIQTGERRFYGCFILKKGVIPPDAR